MVSVSVRERSQRYRERHPDRVRETKRRHRERHPEGPRNAEQRQKNLEAVRRYQRRNQRKVLAAQRETKRRWRERNPEAARMLWLDRWQRWLKRNPQADRERRHRRRARKRAVEIGPIPPDYVEQLRGFQGGRCPYCHEHLPEDFHVDHVIPLSRGGAHAWENLVLACPTCNLRKGARYPGELGLEVDHGREELRGLRAEH